MHCWLLFKVLNLEKKKISQFGYGRAGFEEFTHSGADL